MLGLTRRALLPMAALPLAAGGVGLTLTTISRAAPAIAPAVAIRGVFLADCAVCHGADGAGTSRGPTLVGVGAASVDYWVSTGRMPLSKPTDKDRRRPPRYSPAEIRDLVSYVTTVAGGGPAIPAVNPRVGDIARGGELYRLDCAACHQWSGDGGALLHRDAPPVRAATTAQIAEAVRVGPGQMPAFGAAAITDPDLNGLVAYVRSLRNPDDRGGNPLWHLGPLAEGAVAFVFGLGILMLATRWIGERA